MSAAGGERVREPEHAGGAATQRRLRELAERHGLDGRAAPRLAALLAVLAEDEHAPSAVREPAAAVRVHIADSLAGLEVAQVRAAARAVDIGSGAGFPGLPLAVALERARFSLLESSARKCAFLRMACRAAGAANAEVVCGRAEEWAAGMGTCDVALARALAPQPVVLEYAAPLLRRRGALVDWRGPLDEAQRERSERAADELGLAPAEARPVRFPWDAPDVLPRRYLYLYLKVRDTPERFPRRAGAARKRPLGAREGTQRGRGGSAREGRGGSGGEGRGAAVRPGSRVA
jgi:16S rRNA (guanine527-N7)-methyltransferase